MYDIRPADPADAPALAALKRRTFRETFLEDFAVPYPPDDIAAFEAETYSLEQVESELRDAKHATWIALKDNVMLGYAHIGPCKLPHPDVREGDREIYQIYLAREAQGDGLGKQLMGVVMDALKDAHPIWLGVWSGNDRAQGFYAGYGFGTAGEYKFKVGDWYDHEFVFRRD